MAKCLGKVIHFHYSFFPYQFFHPQLHEFQFLPLSFHSKYSYQCFQWLRDYPHKYSINMIFFDLSITFSILSHWTRAFLYCLPKLCSCLLFQGFFLLESLFSGSFYSMFCCLCTVWYLRPYLPYLNNSYNHGIIYYLCINVHKILILAADLSLM